MTYQAICGEGGWFIQATDPNGDVAGYVTVDTDSHPCLSGIERLAFFSREDAERYIEETLRWQTHE